MEGGMVDDPSITLRNVTLKDAGDYVCVLRNEAGEGRSDTIHMAVFAEYSALMGTYVAKLHFLNIRVLNL